MNYHTVHHFWPRVPWYNLRKAHRVLEPHLEANGALISKGYAATLLDAIRRYGWSRPVYWEFPPKDAFSIRKRHPALGRAGSGD